MRLAEFFALNEGAGRDLHDWLDVIMDMAQEGRDYERELAKFGAAVKHAEASGDVPASPGWDKSAGERSEYYRTHGATRTGDIRNKWRRGGDWNYQSGRNLGNVTYSPSKGDEDSIAGRMADHRERAHTILQISMVDAGDPEKARRRGEDLWMATNLGTPTGSRKIGTAQASLNEISWIVDQIAEMARAV